MNSKEVFIRRLQTQIIEWEEQLKDYQAMVQENAGELQATHEKSLEIINTALKQATDIYDQVQETNEVAWQHMQASTEAAIK